MRDLMRADRTENRFGTDFANQDSRRRHHRHGPDMAPAIAVEHRHDIEVGRMLLQPPSGGGAHAHQILDYLIKDHGRIIYDCEPGDWERGKCKAPESLKNHQH